jgi:hypothetical protein
MMRQILLPVRVMCMIAHFLRFRLQFHGNELNILQKRGRSPFNYGFISQDLKMNLQRHILAQSTLPLRACCVSCDDRITFLI